MANVTSKTRRSRWKRLLLVLLSAFICLIALAYFVYVLPFWGIPFNSSRHTRVPLTPPWALECWLWEDDVNTGAFVKELLEGYEKHDLPVRTILIDSPWSLRYNDFRVDEARYPEPGKFFGDLQQRGYRVVLWMTCNVNSQNRDTKFTESRDFFDEARTNGFLAGNGYEMRWWKGRGGFIDYTNPKAMEWWQGLQKQALDWGIDGWKLDGSDTLFSSRVGRLLVPFNRTHAGWLTTRQYMDLYGRKEYENGLAHNPEFAVLIRSVDRPWPHPEGFAPFDAAPVTWVGDKQHTWAKEERGIESAIADTLAAARLGYCVIGSDVGGYHGRSNPDDIDPAATALLRTWKTAPGSGDGSGGGAASTKTDDIAPNLYIRWAEFSAFCGLFLNGGHGERRLWKRTPGELEIIRKFSWLHTELVPYMYSHVVEAHRGGKSLVRPLRPGRYQYLFGNDFLVAPIFENKPERRVALPSGDWRYFFNDAQVVREGGELTRQFPLDEFPVFLREGAVVPLNVTRPYTGLGDTNSAGYRTWLIYPKGENEFTLWHPETHPDPQPTTVKVTAGAALRVECSGKKEPHILRIFSERKPSRVVMDGNALHEGDAWAYEAGNRKLIIRTRDYRVGNYLVEW